MEDLTGSLTRQQFTYHLTDGEAHSLEWTYNKDSSTGRRRQLRRRLSGSKSVWAKYASGGDPMQFNLTINREQKPAHDLSRTEPTRLFRGFARQLDYNRRSAITGALAARPVYRDLRPHQHQRPPHFQQLYRP